MSSPDVIDLDKSDKNRSVREFAGLSAQTPDPRREPAEGAIYEVEDPENLPQDAKAHDVTLFADEQGDEVPVHIWIAQSEQERWTGLSDKTALQDDEGMLFDWGEFGVRGLTMRNMSFPIDMVFIDEKGYVQRTVEYVQPEDDETYKAACRYALELSAGFCEEHGITTDWRVYRPTIQEDPSVFDLSKQTVQFGNVGGDPFQTYDALEAFVEDLYEAGAEQVYLGDETFEDASGHHDRPVRVDGLSVEEAEEVMADYEDEVLALLGPKEKSAERVWVNSVHEAPDDVLVRCHPEKGLYYQKQMETPPGVPAGAQYLAPDEEPPEGASTYEGPQGATYYLPEGEEDQTPSTDSFGGHEGTETVDQSFTVDSEDSRAFLSYTTGGHQEMNEALRSGEDVPEEAETISRYIQEAPEFDEPVDVYRGLTAPNDLADQLRQSEGGQIELGGFQSTSHDPQVATGFTNFDEDSETPVLMSIETDKGLPMYNMEGGPAADEAAGEQELLLGHDWTYEIQDIEETDDGLVVDMEVVSRE